MDSRHRMIRPPLVVFVSLLATVASGTQLLTAGESSAVALAVRGDGGGCGPVGDVVFGCVLSNLHRDGDPEATPRHFDNSHGCWRTGSRSNHPARCWRS